MGKQNKKCICQKAFVFVAMEFEKNYIVVVISNVLAYLPYLIVQTVALKKYLKASKKNQEMVL